MENTEYSIIEACALPINLKLGVSLVSLYFGLLLALERVGQRSKQGIM